MATPAPNARREQRYCSFCWHVLPQGATDCAECGHTVDQMEAARQARAEADRNWIPPRLWQEGQAPKGPSPARGRLFKPSGHDAPDPVGPAPVGPAPAGPAPVVLSWRHILMAIGIGGCVGGATVAAVWVAIQTFGRPAGAGPLLRTSPTKVVALSPAQLTWKNPVAELRLKLVNSAGAVVAADLKNGEQRSIDPGEYRLRVTDHTGKWAPPEEPVIVAPGEALTLGPSPRIVAGFYLWAGKKLYGERKLDRAERVWRKALKAYPEGVEARAQLAALLAVRYRYAEARQHAREVLNREPTHPEAIQLLKTLDTLEKKR